MVVHKIHIKNFKSFEDQVFDFDNIKGFWEISGVVGSGKTTVGEAILFALFGSVKQKNNTDFISWGERRAIVEIWFESRGYNIYIKRTINKVGQCPIDVKVNGEPLVFSNKRNAQTILETDYYDVSRMALELLCVISFDGFQSFSRMNTQETRQFLDQVFGFRVLTDLSEQCKAKIKDCQNTMTQCAIHLEALKRQIDTFNEWKDKGEVIVDENMLEELKKQQDTLKSQLDSFDRETNAHIGEKHNELTIQKIKSAEVVALGKQKKKDIDFLKKGVCPTCGAPLNQDSLEQHEQERNALMAQYKDIQQNIKDIESEMSTYEQQRTSQRVPLNTSYQEACKKVLECQQNLSKQKECDIEIDKLKKELKKSQKTSKDLSKDVGEWEELSEFLSVKMRQHILKSIIPDMNLYISNYMSLLQQPYNVKFDTDFKCSICVSSSQEISVSNLSTGQQKIVDMVIILAILKILLSKVNFSVILLDELFANLDEDLRDGMCSILKENIKDNQTMFVISHAPLNPQYMDGYIKVRSISGKTKLNIFTN